MKVANFVFLLSESSLFCFERRVWLCTDPLASASRDYWHALQCLLSAVPLKVEVATSLKVEDSNQADSLFFASQGKYGSQSSSEIEKGTPLLDEKDSKATLQTDTGTRKYDSLNVIATVLESVFYSAIKYFSFR